MEMCDILCDLAGRDPGCFVSAGKRRMSCAEIPAAGDLCGCCLCEYFDSGVPAERGAFDHLSGYRAGRWDRDTASGRQNCHGGWRQQQ